MSKFDKWPGAVFARNYEAGSVAVNGYGLPVQVFADLMKSVTTHCMDDDCLVRNAEPNDGLGAGAWYVLTPNREVISKD